MLVRDISAARKNEDLLLEDGELLKLSLERGSRVLWEVDVASRTFRLFNGRRRMFIDGVRLENFPEGLIERGWVHPDSVSRFRKFAEELLGGRPAGGGAFILRHKMSRRFGWFSLFYRALPDRDRLPLKVIGIAEPLSGGLGGHHGQGQAVGVAASQPVLLHPGGPFGRLRGGLVGGRAYAQQADAGRELP